MRADIVIIIIYISIKYLNNIVPVYVVKLAGTLKGGWYHIVIVWWLVCCWYGSWFYFWVLYCCICGWFGFLTYAENYFDTYRGRLSRKLTRDSSGDWCHLFIAHGRYGLHMIANGFNQFLLDSFSFVTFLVSIMCNTTNSGGSLHM